MSKHEHIGIYALQETRRPELTPRPPAAKTLKPCLALHALGEIGLASRTIKTKQTHRPQKLNPSNSWVWRAQGLGRAPDEFSAASALQHGRSRDFHFRN